MTRLSTARLELRPVSEDDLRLVRELGADARVMNSLGGVLTDEQCAAWLERQRDHWRAHGYGRHSVTCGGQFVGFVGLSRTDFDRGIVPGVEIAWRLTFATWSRGYATEAARAVIEHGLSELGLGEIIGVTSEGNARSRRVMDRLRMVHSPSETFEHPLLPEGDALRTHVVYRSKNSE